MQVDLVPFVLENLGCVGDEMHLMDCPTAEGVIEGNIDGDYVGLYNFAEYQPNSAICDPYRDTYARVACGSSDIASAPFPGSMPWLVTSASSP